MSTYPIIELTPAEFPPLLQEITDPPEKIYLRGTLPQSDMKYLCVVGSRKTTTYGKEVCEFLLHGLRGYPVSIVSGLALGMDATAHKAALSANLHTIAVPGSGLDAQVLHPRTNLALARNILDADGALLSEFEPNFKATPWSFPKRNRIMAGLAHAILVIEAEEKSGTLITSRLGADYNRDVLTIPHSIFSTTSKGPHMLLRLGATPITTPEELLEALGFKSTEEQNTFNMQNLSPNEKRVLELLHEPQTKDELLRELSLPTHEAQTLLSAMELKGFIVEQLGLIRTA